VEAAFLPGTDLARGYYLEVVRPLLDGYAPGLRHSAALVGSGSDVLGFDTYRSTDHNWGPRCQIFLGADDGDGAAEITALLADRLPAAFLGWPTRFPDVTAPEPVPRHWVEVAELGRWLTARLGFDPRAGVGVVDWLATPTQALAELTGGEVFSDGLGAEVGGAAGGLRAARAALAWYPDDVWRYVLACQWQRISQEEAFPGRCAEVGDDLGSVVVTARLARDLMRLAMLMRRRYPPYSKWLGSAFARLPRSEGGLHRHLAAALAAPDWPGRERHMCAAYEAVATMHNDLGLTEPVEPAVRPFHDRPFRVIVAGRFVVALIDSISAKEVSRLPMTGAADQFIDSTDATADLPLLRSAVSARLRSYPPPPSSA
jgi:uncharacterized protein DUF4037